MEPRMLNLNQKLTVLNTPIAVNKLRFLSQRESTPNHIHSYIELYCNTEGTSVLKLNFNKQLSVDKDQWVLLSRNLVHEEVVYGRCAGFSLGIETDPRGAALLSGLDKNGYCTGFGERTGALLNEIVKEYTEHPLGYAEYGGHLLSMLLLELCRCCGSKTVDDINEPKPDPDNIYLIIDSFFNRIFQVEFQRESEKMTIEYLAEQLHMSTRHVSRILQKHYGMTFQHMLLATRMRFTEYLLLRTDRSISEICELCELSEPYLIRSFKESYGMTPAQYRRLHRQRQE